VSQPPPPPPSEQPPENAIAAGSPALSAEGPAGRPGGPADEPQVVTNASLADTTGTGTIVALGCIGGTVFLIAIGLLYLLVTQLFG